MSILDPLSRKWHSTVTENAVNMQFLLITRHGSRYICFASKRQVRNYFSRKIIKCKTNILSNLGHCLPILDLRDSYIGPHLFQTKTTPNIVVINYGVCVGGTIYIWIILFCIILCFAMSYACRIKSKHAWQKIFQVILDEKYYFYLKTFCTV